MTAILIVRTCAIGDFVLNLPALRALQSADPSIDFTLIGIPSTVDLARRFINVQAVHSIELDPYRRLFHEPLPLPPFERALVWMKDPSFAENLKASGISRVERFDPFPDSSSRVHASVHLLNTIGMPAPDLPDQWRRSTPSVVLHPGSGSARKCWPYFRELADRLRHPVFVLGPAETEFDAGPHARFEGRNLSDVANLLTGCAGFVGNDSGISHLAGYLGCPAVALFGPTDPAIWGPVGRRVEVLANPVLSSIHPDQVLQKMSKLHII